MAGLMLKPTLTKQIVITGAAVLRFSRAGAGGRLRIHIEADPEVEIFQRRIGETSGDIVKVDENAK